MPATVYLLFTLQLLAGLAFSLAFRRDALNSTVDSAPSKLPAESIAPKVMILSMWPPESEVFHVRWNELNLGNITSQTVFTPGLSMLYPGVSCTEDYQVCSVTLGEGEINAASTMMALVLSSHFDFRTTYWLSAGIAGVNPNRGTLGSVAIARYAIQVGLQYEIDSRDLPESWPSGYIPYGREFPFLYPNITYGSEVFELNVDLQQRAYHMAANATLVDSPGPRDYRKQYAAEFPAAGALPSVIMCDIATSDVYYSGNRLSNAFDRTATIWTNGTGQYCMSAQEENAYLEVLVRAAIEGLVDFGRIIITRGGCDFDRPPPGVADWEHLVHTDQNAFYISLDNLFNVGSKVISGILSDWNSIYLAGIKPSNYVGDIFGSLGGNPDFGLGSITGGRPVQALRRDESGLGKRSTLKRGSYLLEQHRK